MNNKVLVAIDKTGLSQMVVDSLAAQMRPDQADVLVLEIVEPLVRSYPPQMAKGRVAIDKRKGYVKQKVSLSMPEHRDADQVMTKKTH
jgi:hypothetical protein